MERKLLKYCLACFLAVIIVRPAARSESNQKLEALKHLVVEAMSYPAEKLTVEEGPMFGKGVPRDPDLITNAIFGSTDNTFIPLQILIGKTGRVLPAEMRDAFDTALAAPPKVNAPGPRLERRILPDGTIIYAGPGGVGMMFVLLPSQNAEVAFTWTFPTENPVEIGNAPEAYRQMFSEKWSPDDWIKLIHPLATNSLNVMLGEKQTPPDASKPANPRTTPHVGLPESPGNTHRANAGREPTEAPSLWPWVIAGVLMLGLLIAALRKRR